MDVRVLSHLCTCIMEKTESRLELITEYFTDFTPVQLQQLAALDDLYREWNSKINVISRKDIDSLYEKHVLHSLSIAATFEFEKENEIIDIGTGGGFPGIPLAIFFPEVQFHLVDSIAKKIKVVDAVIENTGVKNVTTQKIRAEDIKNRKFDFVVTRAVAPLKYLWKWSKPLLKNKQPTTSPKGLLRSNQLSASSKQQPGLISLKGGDLATEIQESGTRPRIIEIDSIFPQKNFKEKFLLYVTR